MHAACACRQVASISYTPRYAAPEVIRATRRGERDMALLQALDAWSLGVMAFEMCTGAAAFPRGVPAETVCPSPRPYCYWMLFVLLCQ